jgi:hypothetical protein
MQFLTPKNARDFRDFYEMPVCSTILLMEPFHSDHNRLDERSLALHELVARKVQAAPALLDKARGNVRRWQEASGSPSLALAEWEQILSSPVDQVTLPVSVWNPPAML